MAGSTLGGTFLSFSTEGFSESHALGPSGLCNPFNRSPYQFLRLPRSDQGRAMSDRFGPPAGGADVPLTGLLQTPARALRPIRP